MPTEQFWIDNGFSHEKSMAEGVSIDFILNDFMHAKANAEVLVAHNLNFDHRVVWAEIVRSGRKPKSGMHKICTMMKSTKHCQLPQANGRGGYKWPKLEELYRHLFKKPFEGAHDALADVRACKDCFFELLRCRVVEMPAEAVDNFGF